jgi:hypothetical protein
MKMTISGVMIVQPTFPQFHHELSLSTILKSITTQNITYLTSLRPPFITIYASDTELDFNELYHTYQQLERGGSTVGVWRWLANQYLNWTPMPFTHDAMTRFLFNHTPPNDRIPASFQNVLGYLHTTLRCSSLTAYDDSLSGSVDVGKNVLGQGSEGVGDDGVGERGVFAIGSFSSWWTPKPSQHRSPVSSTPSLVSSLRNPLVKSGEETRKVDDQAYFASTVVRNREETYENRGLDEKATLTRRWHTARDDTGQSMDVRALGVRVLLPRSKNARKVGGEGTSEFVSWWHHAGVDVSVLDDGSQYFPESRPKELAKWIMQALQ